MRLAIVLVASTFVPALSEAAAVYSSAASDAVAYSDWAGGGDAKGVFNQSTAYIISDNNSVENVYWNQAVFEFPLASLAGQHDLQATLNLYTTFSQWDTTPSVSGAQLATMVPAPEACSTRNTSAPGRPSRPSMPHRPDGKRSTYRPSSSRQSTMATHGQSFRRTSPPGNKALVRRLGKRHPRPQHYSCPGIYHPCSLASGRLLCRRRRNGSSHASSVEDASA